MKDKSEIWLKIIYTFIHELRTPLGGIIGYSELLQIVENLNLDDQKEISNVIHKASNNLVILVSEMFSCFGIISGKHNLYLEMCDISNLLMQVEKALNNQYWMSHGRSFQFIIENDMEIANIEADKNLLINMFLWFFGDNSLHYDDSEKTNVYFIHIVGKPEFIEISISNITGDQKSKINKSDSESPWMTLILEMLKKHSGHLKFKVDGSNKNFAVITFPLHPPQEQV
jgi:K+-sensing histidine kinase KdpD